VNSVHRETPSSLVGGKTHADTSYTGPKSYQKRRELHEKTKYNETSKLLPSPQYLRPRLYIPTPVTDPDDLGETCQPDLECFQDVQPAPSWCVCGCNRHIERDNAAFNSATESRVRGRLPIPLFPRLSLGVVVKMADLVLAVCNDREAIRGKRYCSALYSVSLV